MSVGALCCGKQSSVINIICNPFGSPSTTNLFLVSKKDSSVDTPFRHMRGNFVFLIILMEGSHSYEIAKCDTANWPLSARVSQTN